MHREEPESVYQHAAAAAAVSDLSCFFVIYVRFPPEACHRTDKEKKNELMCSQLCRRDVTTKNYQCICVYDGRCHRLSARNQIVV